LGRASLDIEGTKAPKVEEAAAGRSDFRLRAPRAAAPAQVTTEGTTQSTNAPEHLLEVPLHENNRDRETISKSKLTVSARPPPFDSGCDAICDTLGLGCPSCCELEAVDRLSMTRETLLCVVGDFWLPRARYSLAHRKHDGYDYFGKGYGRAGERGKGFMDDQRTALRRRKPPPPPLLDRQTRKPAFPAARRNERSRTTGGVHPIARGSS